MFYGEDMRKKRQRVFLQYIARSRRLFSKLAAAAAAGEVTHSNWTRPRGISGVTQPKMCVLLHSWEEELDCRIRD